jgi:hypothetical protein
MQQHAVESLFHFSVFLTLQKLFLGLDEADRVMYIESIVGSDDCCISI